MILGFFSINQRSGVLSFVCLRSRWAMLQNFPKNRLNRDKNVVITDYFQPNFWRNNIINVLFIWHIPGNCVNCR